MSFTGIFKAKDGIVAVVDSKASRVENGQSFEDIQRNPENYSSSKTALPQLLEQTRS
ncbi:MAG: hypothetical protein ACLUTO_03020 [Anaerostipes sp.]